MKIIINDKANLKLKYFVSLVDSEISGMAKSIWDKKEEVIYITDFIIFEQDVSSATTLITDEAIAKFTYELMKKGEKTEEWNVWWHSHADMGASWSEKDEATINEHTNQGHLISLVTNKAGDIKARLDIFPKDTSPFKKTSYCTFDIKDIEIEENTKLIKEKEKFIKIIEEAELEIEELEEKHTDNKKIENFCQKEIDSKIKNKIFEFSKRNRQYSYLSSHQQNKKEGNKKKWTWFDSTFDKFDGIGGENWIADKLGMKDQYPY